MPHTNHPENDTEFEDKKITRVETSGARHTITSEDDWSLYAGDDCPIVPEVGQTARFYGRGIGYLVRGLFINGVKSWYRTPVEQEEYHEISTYGKDAADWLKRWDDDRSVWSIEMGGLGPAYEQCIQITVAEALRWYIKNVQNPNDLTDTEKMVSIREQRDKSLFANPVIKQLGLSGAQHGAAMNLAGTLYVSGPRKVFTDPTVKNRLIQVSKHFPDPYAKV